MSEKYKPVILTPISSSNNIETPESYLATCHKFRMENIKYYEENNFYRGNLLPVNEGKDLKDDSARDTLDEVLSYYESRKDNYNIQRYYEKIGDKEEAYRMAEKISESGNLIEKAHSAREIRQRYGDERWGQNAIDCFLELVNKYKSENNNLMAAVNSDLLYCITGKQEFRDEAIELHRLASGERNKKGDSWWTAISLREIAKLTHEENDIKMAFETANFEILRAENAGCYKNAGLWARDLAHLTRSSLNPRGNPDEVERAKNLFLKQIDISGAEGDIRTIAKSYWEMWKVTGEEEHRLKTLENYKKLLVESKERKNQERIEECYRALLYLTQ